MNKFVLIFWSETLGRLFLNDGFALCFEPSAVYREERNLETLIGPKFATVRDRETVSASITLTFLFILSNSDNFWANNKQNRLLIAALIPVWNREMQKIVDYAIKWKTKITWWKACILQRQQ